MSGTGEIELPSPFRGAGDHIAITLAGAEALFTTRHGGTSSGPYASLNLGLLTDDDVACTRENRQILRANVGGEPAWALQVHAATVERRHTTGASGGEADGQATATPGIAPMVVTADCLGVVIASADAVAVVHAGWRGLASGVIRAGARAVRALSADRGAPLLAAVGPGAGVCCYEVGDEVRARFSAYGETVVNGRNLDLKAVAAAQLAAAGVAEVHDVGLCTICDPHERFYSHRRDRGVTGRQAVIAWLS